MTEKNVKELGHVSEIDKAMLETIKRKSAHNLPDRPSERGMRPAEIKQAFWSPMLDNKDSLLSEINRIVGELNAVLSAFHTEYANYAERIVDLENHGVALTTFIDNLDSSEKHAALSANQGRVLNEKILLSVAGLNYDAQTGVITVRRNDGTEEKIDIPVELLSIGVEDRINEESGKLELRLIFRGPGTAEDGSDCYSSWFALDDLTEGFVKKEPFAELAKEVESLQGDASLLKEATNNLQDNVSGLESSINGNPTPGIEYVVADAAKTYCKVMGIGTAVDKNIVLASVINGIPVKSIDASAFYKADITSVVIPGSITTIPTNAFKSSSLETVVLCEGVKYIGQAAFQYCGSLTSVTIPKSLNTVAQYAFQSCSKLAEIIIPEGVTSVGQKAFQNCYALSILCESESKPSGWDENWNYSNRPVTWSYIQSFGAVNARFEETNARLAENEKNDEAQQDFLDFLTLTPTSDLYFDLDITLGSATGYCTCAGIGCATRENIVIGRSYTLAGTACETEGIAANAFEGETGIKRIFISKYFDVGSNAFKDCSSKLKIFTDAASKPAGWADDWNPDNRTVIWGWNVKNLVDRLIAVENNKADVGHTHDGIYSTEGHSHKASDITEGTFASDRIPNITSDKITSLDANKLTGTVPSSCLPSYVDDTVEGTLSSDTVFKNSSGTAVTGESGKIYVDTTTNKTYRWSGSKYVEISASLALGETSSTAYRGDCGATAYAHSQERSGNPHNVQISEISGLQTALDGKSPTAHNHDGTYSPTTHNHDSAYSKTGHTHDYAPTSHNHDGAYSKEGHVHSDLENRITELEAILESTEGRILYQINAIGTYSVIGVSNTMRATADIIIVPETVNGIEVTHVANYAFQNCTARIISLGSNVSCLGGSSEDIVGDAQEDSALENSQIFSGCSNLTDIYVIFPEDPDTSYVYGAPWGAPSSATIHYEETL